MSWTSMSICTPSPDLRPRLKYGATDSTLLPVALHSFHPAGLVYLRAWENEGRGERRLALLARSAYLERISPPLRLRRRHEEAFSVGRGIERLDVPPLDEHILAPALRLHVEEQHLLVRRHCEERRARNGAKVMPVYDTEFRERPRLFDFRDRDAFRIARDRAAVESGSVDEPEVFAVVVEPVRGVEEKRRLLLPIRIHRRVAGDVEEIKRVASVRGDDCDDIRSDKLN